MTELFWVLDILACWLLFYLAAAFLAVSAVQTPRQVMVVLGQIGILVFAFVGGIVIWESGPRVWWATGLRLSTAIIGVGLYDRQFGVRRHLRLAREWCCSHFAKLRDALP